VCEATPLDLRPFSVLKERPKFAPELERLHQAGALVETDKRVFEMVSRVKGVQPVYLPVKNGGWLNSVQERLFVPLNEDPKTG
jgi:hypothetical protein